MTRSRTAPTFYVYLDGVRTLDAQVLFVSQTISAKNDTAVFTIEDLRPISIDNPRSRLIVQDVALSESAKDLLCKITMVSSRWTGERVIHLGRVVAANIVLAESGEMVTYTSRMEPRMLHSDEDSRGVWYVGKMQDDWLDVDVGAAISAYVGDLVFNPVFNGMVVPNMVTGFPARNEIILPESLPSDPASIAVLPSLDLWTIADAVEYVCRVYNEMELHVQNPDVIKLAEEAGTETYFRNVRIPWNSTLNQALDTILIPYGYGWFISYANAGGPRIVIRLKHNALDKKTFYLARYGDPLDADTSEIHSCSIQYDITNRAVDSVTVRMKSDIIEGTFELVPAWEKTKDTLTKSDLSDQNVELNPDRQRVWRDFVLNESGEYNSILDARFGPGNVAFDLYTMFEDAGVTPEFGSLVQKRRTFEPMFTMAEDGSPIKDSHGGMYIEYTMDAGVTWNEIGKLLGGPVSIKALKNECGIRFSSQGGPPDKLMAMAIIAPTASTSGSVLAEWYENFKIRVTACVSGDSPTHIRQFVPVASSVLKDSKGMLYDASRSFEVGAYHPDSKFKADIDAGKYKTKRRDDYADGRSVGKELLDAWKNATCSGTVTLEGLDREVSGGVHRSILGTKFESIFPRNVDFKTSPPGTSDAWPTIIGIKFDVQSQKTVLTLDSPRRRLKV